MSDTRFDRQVRWFGKVGQEKLASCHVAVVGVGGLGTHVVQQLAHLGVGRLTLTDHEELDDTNRNRYIGSRHDDAVPGSRKVDLGERMVRAINAHIGVQKIFASLLSAEAFAAIRGADVVFGCLDSEGARLVLNELCAAFELPYIDLATEIFPGPPMTFGGRVCVSWNRPGCIVCHGLLDATEVREDLAGEKAREVRAALYGVTATELEPSGPSVVSVNGVVASLGVSEFLCGLTGLRLPKPVLTYRGHMGGVSVTTDPPSVGCYYCTVVYGRREAAGVDRYVHPNATAANG